VKWALTAAAVVAALVFWTVRDRAPVRIVAFDNLYGDVRELRVHVKVDGGAEQPLDATCDPKTCTFEIPLTPNVHVVTMAVEQNGRRSSPATVTLDASAPPSR
jgi:hypothetical protein